MSKESRSRYEFLREYITERGEQMRAYRKQTAGALVLVFSGGAVAAQAPAILKDNGVAVNADDACIYEEVVPNTLGSRYYYADADGVAEFRNKSDPGGTWGNWGEEAYGEEGDTLQARYPTGTSGAQTYTSDSNTGAADRNSFADPNVECDSPLPVTLISFKGAYDIVEKDVNLARSTASELNNSHFDVERSTDGKNFDLIGRVEGHGTTQEVQDYSFEDKELPPAGGIAYYRLHQIDFDGGDEYHPLITIDLPASPEQATAFPNPLADFLTITAPEGIDDLGVVNMVDMQGRTVYSCPMKNGDGIDVSKLELASGIYILTSSSQAFAPMRLVKG